MATLSGFFGGLAVLIATIGLYGVMSYTSPAGAVEIGIRMALGADAGQVVRMIVREALRLLAAGAVVGIALSVGAGRWAGTLLYEVKPWDPVTLAIALGGARGRHAAGELDPGPPRVAARARRWRCGRSR